MTAAIRDVLQACKETGERPLMVGGSVRDALLASLDGTQVDPKDIDIGLHGTGAGDLRWCLPGDVSEVGFSVGVLTTRINGQDFDISLPRRDSKTGDGHRGFSVDLDPDITIAEAFGRRDFTINSMGWDPETGELIDRAPSPRIRCGPCEFCARFNLEIAPDTLVHQRRTRHTPISGTMPTPQRLLPGSARRKPCTKPAIARHQDRTPPLARHDTMFSPCGVGRIVGISDSPQGEICAGRLWQLRLHWDSL